jgi:HEPN domain.
MSFLRDRAEEFLDNAKYNLGKGFYNLVMFDIEQFIQLLLKILDISETRRLP